MHHFPLNWPADKEFWIAPNPIAFFKEAVTKQAEWQAVLEIDGETTEKAFIQASGFVSDKPSQKARPKKGKASGLEDYSGV